MSREIHLRVFIGCTFILAAGIFYYMIDPASVPLPECPFYQITNLYCPGCGSQRGLHALLHGDISGAVAYNPLMVLGLLFFAAEGGIWLFSQRGSRLSSLSSKRYTPVIAFAVVCLFWIMRNIPYSPFSLLAP